MKLRQLAHSRSGDKGNTSNLSLIAYEPAHYAHLCAQVTAERVRRHFEGIVHGAVRRYELPELAALNFVLDDALGGGVTRSLALDAHGKSLSAALLELDIEPPPAGSASCTAEDAPLCEPVEHLPKAEDFLLWPPNVQAWGYRIVDRLFASRTIARGRSVRALRYGPPLDLRYECASGEFGLAEFMDRNSLSGLLVLKDGEVRAERYALGLQPGDRWSTMSTVKSITATLTGMALHEGAIGSLDDPVPRYVDQLAGTAYEEVSIRHLLTMSSGVAWNEDYADRHSDVNRYSKALADKVDGGVFALLRTLGRSHAPGTRWHYNTGDTFLLGAVTRSAVGMPLADYVSRRLWGPAGMEFDAFYTLESAGGLEIGGSRAGIALRDLGRFAQFVLDDGVTDGRCLLPPGWNEAANAMAFRFGAVEVAAMPQIASGSLAGYGYSWWIGHEGALVAVGFAGQRIYIRRDAHLAIVTLGAFPAPPYRGPAEHDRPAEVVAFTDAVRRALQG